MVGFVNYMHKYRENSITHCKESFFFVIVCRNVHSRSAGRHVIEMLQQHGTLFSF